MSASTWASSPRPSSQHTVTGKSPRHLFESLAPDLRISFSPVFSEKSLRLPINSFTSRWQRTINMEKINSGTLDYVTITFSVSLVSESVLDEKSTMCRAPQCFKVAGKPMGSLLRLSPAQSLELGQSSPGKMPVLCRPLRSKTEAKFHVPHLFCICN